MGGAPGTPLVELRQVRRVFEGGRVVALDGVDLRLGRGEFVAVTGPSGSGKTTLLNLMGAMDLPDEGQVIFEGRTIDSRQEMERVRAERIGFVFQMHNLIPTLTALENVEVPMYETRLGGGKRRARARELLELVGLGPRLNFLPNQMSGGERQRVAIARALANHPAILLADEPTGNLDSTNTADIMRLLSELNQTQGTTLIVVTHNSQAARAAHRAITIRDGKIQRDVSLDGTFEMDLVELKNSPLGEAILAERPLPAHLRGLAPGLRDLLEDV
jgi:ABC-type lipoprotein export system ATPase subunit